MNEIFLGEVLEEINIRNKELLAIPVCSVTNQEGFCSPRDHFSKDVFSKDLSNYKIVRRGEFAYNPSRINVGSIDFLREDVALVSPLYVTFRCDKSIIQKYLKYYLKGEKGNAFIRLKARGAVRDTLSFNSLSEISIPLPEAKKQEQIILILDTADSLRQKRKEQIVLFDDYLKSVFIDMFGDPVKNEKNYSITRIREIVKDVKYGTSKKANKEKGQYPIIRMNNITYSGEWNLSDLKFIDLEKNEIEKYTIKKGDLLFNRTNSKELVGKTAVFKYDQIMAFAGYLIRCRFDEEKASSVYVAYFLNSSYGKSKLEHMCKNIVGMANINAQELQDIDIVLPPISIQKKFASIVEQVEQLKQKMHTSLSEMDNHFNALMQIYFG